MAARIALVVGNRNYVIPAQRQGLHYSQLGEIKCYGNVPNITCFNRRRGNAASDRFLSIVATHIEIKKVLDHRFEHAFYSIFFDTTRARFDQPIIYNSLRILELNSKYGRHKSVLKASSEGVNFVFRNSFVKRFHVRIIARQR